MSNNEIEYSENGDCPYCRSVDVIQTATSISDARASSNDKYPEARHKVWKCKNCKKSFLFEEGF